VDTNAAIDRFLESPGLSASTRRAYRFDVEEFGSWLGARGKRVDDVDVPILAAYAFARLRFRGREALFLLYLGTLMVPPRARVKAGSSSPSDARSRAATGLAR